MNICKHCGCRLYNDFGLGLYEFNGGGVICPSNESGYHELEEAQ
jgi:hypothetical protein